MQKCATFMEEIKLAGICVRTNNTLEASPATAKIAITSQKFFIQALLETKTWQKAPWKTYCVYTDYASNFMGDYTYFIGKEVLSFDYLPEGFSTLIIPAQNYVKFTNGPGAMPAVCMDIWQKVWQMTPDDLGGSRSYIADFEVYDKRALDDHNATLDVFIGIVEPSTVDTSIWA